MARLAFRLPSAIALVAFAFGIVGGYLFIQRRYPIRTIGLVPIGDRFTMSGQMAALAVTRFFHFETVVPCHYGTFDVLDPDASHFVAAMQGHAAKVAVPRIGEVLQF